MFYCIESYKIWWFIERWDVSHRGVVEKAAFKQTTTDIIASQVATKSIVLDWSVGAISIGRRRPVSAWITTVANITKKASL